MHVSHASTLRHVLIGDIGLLVTRQQQADSQLADSRQQIKLTFPPSDTDSCCIPANLNAHSFKGTQSPVPLADMIRFRTRNLQGILAATVTENPSCQAYLGRIACVAVLQ